MPKITMSKQKIAHYKRPGLAKMYNESYKTVRIYITGYNDLKTVYAKFKKILVKKFKEIYPEIENPENKIIIENNEFSYPKYFEPYFTKLWPQFKNLCFNHRNISRKIKAKCDCNNYNMCLLVDCTCGCHNEDRFFYPAAWELSALDAVLMSVQSFGPNSIQAKHFIQAYKSKLSNTEKTIICNSCKSLYCDKNFCNKCELLIRYDETKCLS